MTYQTLLYEKADGVATVILNRPDKLNALNSTVYNELYAAFEAAESDPEVGAIILTDTSVIPPEPAQVYHITSLVG